MNGTRATDLLEQTDGDRARGRRPAPGPVKGDPMHDDMVVRPARLVAVWLALWAAGVALGLLTLSLSVYGAAQLGRVVNLATSLL